MLKINAKIEKSIRSAFTLVQIQSEGSYYNLNQTDVGQLIPN